MFSKSHVKWTRKNIKKNQEIYIVYSILDICHYFLRTYKLTTCSGNHSSKYPRQQLKRPMRALQSLSFLSFFPPSVHCIFSPLFDGFSFLPLGVQFVLRSRRSNKESVSRCRSEGKEISLSDVWTISECGINYCERSVTSKSLPSVHSVDLRKHRMVEL